MTPAGKDTEVLEQVTEGQVVQFTHTDPVLGGQLTDVGVVVAVDGDLVRVAPVALHTIAVAAGDVQPLGPGS